MIDETTTNLLIFGGGLILAGTFAYLVYLTIEKSPHPWTTAGTCAFVSLGIFCISMPKINNLMLKYGENVLKVGELEKQVEKTKLDLAAMNKSYEHLFVLKMITEKPDSVVHAGSNYYLSANRATEILKGIMWKKFGLTGDKILKVSSEKEPAHSSENPNASVAAMPTMYLIDPRTQQEKKLDVDFEHSMDIRANLNKLDATKIEEPR